MQTFIVLYPPKLSFTQALNNKTGKKSFYLNIKLLVILFVYMEGTGLSWNHRTKNLVPFRFKSEDCLHVIIDSGGHS